MSYPRLDPQDINQPIQLLGASLVGAVLLVGEFLYASLKVESLFISGMYGITAILIFPIILYFIFVLQTKHRDKLQSDPYYLYGKFYGEQVKNSKEINLNEIRKWLKKN